MYDRIFHPFLLQLLDGESFEQIFLSLEISLHRRDKQRLAKTAGTAQKVVLRAFDNVIDKIGLVYIKEILFSYFLEGLYA